MNSAFPSLHGSYRLRAWAALCLVAVSALLLFPQAAFAQAGAPIPGATPGTAPTFWYLLAAAVAFMVPVGLVLMGVAGLPGERAWGAALGALGALAVAGIAYYAVGFALQFGGIGLTYPHAELRNLVWEWSPLPTDWGVGWGAAGLSGWFLSGEVTALNYALFLSHLPWVFTVALLPALALRGRAPALVGLLLGLLLGGLIYPLAGNWVQGGGWLSALGRNLQLGHGFVDVGGAGTVFLLTAAFGLSVVVLWIPRRERRTSGPAQLPPDYQPLLTVTGALFVMAGAVGWLWANPLQAAALDNLALMRGSVNLLLAAVAGVLLPFLYTWFVSGNSHPTLAARGLAAGTVAALAGAPFLTTGSAVLVGLLAGATVPFVAYIVDHLLHLDDRTGLVASFGMPALIGLLAVGILADGRAGAGWQLAGIGSFLGVPGQGVSGMLIGAGFQRDFPGQLQAQVIGATALLLWGFLTGLAVGIPVALIFYGLQRSSQDDGKFTPAPLPAPMPAAVPGTPPATARELVPGEGNRSAFQPGNPPNG
jgi:Amt family ammonium transporter